MKTALGILVVAGLADVARSPDMVVHYAFDEAAGPTAVDGSGRGHSAAHQNGVVVSTDHAPVPGGNPRSILLNPGASAYVRAPNHADYTFTGDFTVAAWIKPLPLAAGVNPNDRGAIVQKWNWLSTPGTHVGYGVDRHRDGRIMFITGTTEGFNNLISTLTTPDNVWSHVAVTYGGGRKRIYVNASLNVSEPYGPPGASSAPLHIGKDDWIRNFYGNIDEVRLFNRALLPEEILVLKEGMAAPAGLVAEPGLAQIHLTWTASPAASGYTVYQSTTPGGGYAPVATVTGTSLTIDEVYHPTRYYYVVVAQGLMTSGFSNEASAVPISTVPRTNDHAEGLFEDRCACGSSIPGRLEGALLAVVLLAAAFARRL
ncbi:MAG TPA: LamG domain-containing protein [Planctomycetota bacterium]|nr:LamG domain-containing protein [Planctomycetota bacterium]